MPKKFDTTFYEIKSKRFAKGYRFAVVADIHADAPEGLCEKLSDLSPDFILMPGDSFERLDGSQDAQNEASYAFIEKISDIAPVFLSVGNHENGGLASWNAFKWFKIESIPKYYSPKDTARIEALNAEFLDDRFVLREGIAFGGLSSGLINEGKLPDVKWLSDFSRLECPKVLLCHHPEYYEKYLKDLEIDLIVCGHAHGGQWRFFGRGVFAPGQGLLPKYTSGVIDGRAVISRGLKRSRKIPRIFNKPELVIIDITR